MARLALCTALAACVSCTTLASPRAVRRETAAFEATYGVRIERALAAPDLGTAFGPVDAAATRSDQIATFLPILIEEAGKLAPGAFRCAGVRKIALVRRLTVAGQARAAVPDWTHRTLVLDVGYAATMPDYARWVFHHELFHLLDYADNELIRFDPEWTALNAPGFAYGPGGDRAYHDPDSAYAWDAPPPGFVSLYATLGAEEDKAETFAALMMEPDELATACTQDAVLRAKVELLRRRLRDVCAG
jgi:hypothetical protein